MTLRRALLRAALVGLVGAAPAPAQQIPDASPAPVLTLDQDRLFFDSDFGRQTLAEVEGNAQDLQAENRRIEADLEAEERALTERRAMLPPEEFRAAADAFDEKVQAIRSAQAAKARELAQQRDVARQRFLEAAAPVLAAIMTERGAVAILDRASIILSFDRVDITDAAIERVDAVLAGEGPGPDASGPADLERGTVVPDAPGDGGASPVVPAPEGPAQAPEEPRPGPQSPP